ncbi:sigma-70 family RNA polymerase sigma factor [uncultured Paracoccus sp.]|uniref:RNA polymerase sigma factor n=1 Tax=uncultured Paracoccus sp. TaxID=189685 RepID=UPI0026281B0F|nr:sigma-70 family RNA polymerase sigma factor [uncultured Paracoccus sp.]
MKSEDRLNVARADPDAFDTPTADVAVREALTESRRQLLGFLRRRLHSEEEAEEVLQAFTLQAIEHSAELRNVAAVRGWLSRILGNCIADHQRRAVRQRQQETVMSPEQFEAFSLDPDEDLEEAICNCLYKLLPTLKRDQADLIRRIDLSGETRKAVALRLGITGNALTVRLHRARRALKQRLVDMCLTCPVHGYLDCACDEAEAARQRLAGMRDMGKQ